MDHQLQGQMVSAQEIVSSNESMAFLDETTYIRSIKRKLIDKIAQHIYDNNLIEFTKAENIMNDKIHYNARIFVVPDSQVRLLRTSGRIK